MSKPNRVLEILLTSSLSLNFTDGLKSNLDSSLLPVTIICLVYINGKFTNLKNLERAGEEKMTSMTHQFKNAMRVYAAELICSLGVLGFQTFKSVFCMYNKLVYTLKF